jgi:hypothetical protein
MVGIRSPDGLVVGLAPATLEFFGFDSQTRGTRENRAPPALKYRVPHGSQPRPGWAPDPLMVGIRSPDGLVVGLGLHQPPWSFGFDSQTRGTRENRAPPCVKVTFTHSTGFLTGPNSSSTHRFPDDRTHIEATPLSATSAELGLGLGLGLGLDSLSHFSSHALPFFSPPSFHTLSLSPAFTSVWWSA